MDALEFIKTAQRYAKEEGYESVIILKSKPPEKILEKLEQWADANPIKTRQSELRTLPQRILAAGD